MFDFMRDSVNKLALYQALILNEIARLKRKKSPSTSSSTQTTDQAKGEKEKPTFAEQVKRGKELPKPVRSDERISD